jgi:putative tryptophan/tyrosine transport system substrate-binding protein
MGPAIFRQRRRRFLHGGLALAGLGLLSGCGLLPPRGRASAEIPRVGYLVATAGLAPQNEAFRQELRELGYIEGQTIALEYRFAGGETARFPELASELVRLRVDVIVASSTAAAEAAQAATATTPVVFVGVSADPVGQGLVASLARPGGNLTGLLLNPVDSDLGSKRLELLRDTVLGLSRLAVIWGEGPGAAITLPQVERAAWAHRLEVQSLRVRAAEEIAGAFAAAVGGGAQAVLVPLSPLSEEHPTRIVELAARSRLPAMYETRRLVDAGGLMTYAVDLADVHRRAATYVDRILKGAKPAVLPVEQPTKFDFIVNLNTAQTLGLTIPQSVLQQATEVIQ